MHKCNPGNSIQKEKNTKKAMNRSWLKCFFIKKGCSVKDDQALCNNNNNNTLCNNNNNNTFLIL